MVCFRLRYIKLHRPTWVIGAPPCGPFSILNRGMNYPKMQEADVKAKMAYGRRHRHFMISLYQLQLSEGRHFLHQHPASNQASPLRSLSLCAGILASQIPGLLPLDFRHTMESSSSVHAIWACQRQQGSRARWAIAQPSQILHAIRQPIAAC